MRWRPAQSRSSSIAVVDRGPEVLNPSGQICGCNQVCGAVSLLYCHFIFVSLKLDRKYRRGYSSFSMLENGVDLPAMVRALCRGRRRGLSQYTPRPSMEN